MFKKEEVIWAWLRISLGLVFLWAFLDKLFGLGFHTTKDKSWLLGTSPTSGFLQFGTHGPFVSIYQSLAGSALIDWLFMLGLLFLGIALIFGIALRTAGYAGALLVFLMWLALHPPENHPFLDEHLIYGLILIGIANVRPIGLIGYGKSWYKNSIVKHNKILQ